MGWGKSARMTTGLAVAAFLAGSLVSLATSWLLVSRLERVGERLGLSEALLGVVAALAADAPEVTSAVAAMADHQQRLGAGVVIGSNVFNLAGLLGLGAVVAGGIGLHRKVVLLGGTVAMGVAGVCLAVVVGAVPPGVGCVLGLSVLVLYVAALSAPHLGLARPGLARPGLARRWVAWLWSAVAEEEAELESAIRPVPGRWPDAAVAAGALAVVVVASVTMERAASALGSRFAVPEIVVGGLVLAAVTSLPNAVAAVYLAARGRGAATLSTALNSNALNVAAGLLIPAALLGLGRPSAQTVLTAVWYLGLTAAVLALAYRDFGIRRGSGALVITAYAVFAASVLGLAYGWSHAERAVIVAGLAVVALFVAQLAFHRKPASGHHPYRPPAARQGTQPQVMKSCANGSGPGHANSGIARSSPIETRQRSPFGGWPTRNLWILGLELSCVIGAVDTVLGGRVVLIGLLIIGSCCAALTGRWLPTALTGLWVTGLAVVLAFPDGIWGSDTFYIWFGAVATVSLATTTAAAVVQRADVRTHADAGEASPGCVRRG